MPRATFAGSSVARATSTRSPGLNPAQTIEPVRMPGDDAEPAVARTVSTGAPIVKK